MEISLTSVEPRERLARKRRFSVVIPENSIVSNAFNILPGRTVSESFRIKEYRIADGYIESVFDRDYRSAMVRSPDHVIVTTMMVHTQKLIYVYLCHEFGLGYDPDGPEMLKIWVKELSIKLPRLVRQRLEVVQSVEFRRIVTRPDASWEVEIHSRIDALAIAATLNVFRVRQ